VSLSEAAEADITSYEYVYLVFQLYDSRAEFGLFVRRGDEPDAMVPA